MGLAIKGLKADAVVTRWAPHRKLRPLDVECNTLNRDRLHGPKAMEQRRALRGCRASPFGVVLLSDVLLQQVSSDAQAAAEVKGRNLSSLH